MLRMRSGRKTNPSIIWGCLQGEVFPIIQIDEISVSLCLRFVFYFGFVTIIFLQKPTICQQIYQIDFFIIKSSSPWWCWWWWWQLIVSRVDATASRVQSAVTTKKVSKSMEVTWAGRVESENEILREWWKGCRPQWSRWILRRSPPWWITSKKNSR